MQNQNKMMTSQNTLGKSANVLNNDYERIISNYVVENNDLIKAQKGKGDLLLKMLNTHKNQEKEKKKLEKENKKLQEKIIKLQKKINDRKQKDLEILEEKKLKKMQTGIKKLDCKLEKMETDKLLINIILDLSLKIYNKFAFSGKEGHFQMALDYELRHLGKHVLSEVARPYNYTSVNGKSIQMPYNITGREDLVLPDEKMILELKQTGKISEKEINQLCRYLEERKNHTEWGENVSGILVNFGDSSLECYYACYDNNKLNIIKVLKQDKVKLTDIVNMYEL